MIAGWCLDNMHRARCWSTRCECECHALTEGWFSLGTPGQVALRWAVRVTTTYGQGDPYPSDVVHLRALARDGYVEQTDTGAWRATRKGFGMFATRHEGPRL